MCVCEREGGGNVLFISVVANTTPFHRGLERRKDPSSESKNAYVQSQGSGEKQESLSHRKSQNA